MERRLVFRLGLALGLVLSAPGVGQDEKPREINGWGTVTDPDGDCQLETDDGALRIKIPGKKHDLNPSEPYNNIKAPRVLNSVEGDFKIQVRVNRFETPEANASDDGSNPFVSGGLVLFVNDKTLIRFDRACSGGGSPFFLMHRFDDGKDAGFKSDDVRNDPLVLHIEREGNTFIFAISKDGENAKEEVHRDTIPLPKKISVGVHAINTSNREFDVRLDLWKLEKK